MKGKRRGRDFIIISFSRSRYIFVFTKALRCCVTPTIMWSYFCYVIFFYSVYNKNYYLTENREMKAKVF